MPDEDDEDDYATLLAAAVLAANHTAQPGRNEPCPCGSGRKYKHCHLQADDEGVPSTDLHVGDEEAV